MILFKKVLFCVCTLIFSVFCTDVGATNYRGVQLINHLTRNKKFLDKLKNNVKKRRIIYRQEMTDVAIKIFIDQGHNPTGFPNSGAQGNGIYEQDITYNVGKYLESLLKKDPRFEVKVSRPTKSTVLGTSSLTSLESRVNSANSWGANYFISIHVNANDNPNINGTECYVYSDTSKGYYLAIPILNSIVEELKTKNNGVRIRPSLYVLRKTNMPSVLVELAYISNYADSIKLKNDQYKFAVAIYKGMLDYFKFS